MRRINSTFVLLLSILIACTPLTSHASLGKLVLEMSEFAINAIKKGGKTAKNLDELQHIKPKDMELDEFLKARQHTESEQLKQLDAMRGVKPEHQVPRKTEVLEEGMLTEEEMSQMSRVLSRVLYHSSKNYWRNNRESKFTEQEMDSIARYERMLERVKEMRGHHIKAKYQEPQQTTVKNDYDSFFPTIIILISIIVIVMVAYFFPKTKDETKKGV